MNEIVLDAGGFLGAFFLLQAITKKTGSVATLAHLFSVIWGPCILAAQFFSAAFGSLGVETVAVLFGAWWALLAGFLLAVSRPPVIHWGADIDKNRTLAVVLILFGMQAALTVRELPSLDVAAPTDAVVLTLRSNTHDDANTDLTAKVPWYLELFRNDYFVYLPLAVLMRKRGWLRRPTLCALVLAAAVLAMSHMTRAPLLGIVATMWASWTLLYRPPAWRAWGVGGVAIIAFSGVFYLVQVVLQTRNLNAESDDGVGLIEGYYGGSMLAFETILDGTFPREDGLYTADMVNYTLKKLDLVNDYPALVRPYAPNGTNIYTFLDAYALDGGIAGALAGAALTGLAAGWLFSWASRRQSPLLLICYGLFADCLAIAVANNEFIRIAPVMTIVLACMVELIVVRRHGFGGVSVISRPALGIAVAQRHGNDSGTAVSST